ncbi:MAG: GDSL-type esterase/lipase family protein [Planctomycetota bacterium]
MRGASKLLAGLLAALAIAGAFWWPFGQARDSASVPCRRWELRWLNRHRQLCRQAAAGPHDLVFVGDSITQNWETDGSEVWQKYYAHRNALNLGIASDRTQHVLWRMANTDLSKALPKLIVLLVGTNNSADDEATETAAGVEAIVLELKHKCPTAKILLMAIFPRGEEANDSRRLRNDETNAIIKRLADDESIFFADIGARLANPNGAASIALMPDALHLNAEGYAAWAAAIEPNVQSLLGEADLASGAVGNVHESSRDE